MAPQVHTPSHACSCTAEAAPALHRLEVRSAPRPACRPAVSAPPCAGRGAALALTEAKGRPAARLLLPQLGPRRVPTEGEATHEAAKKEITLAVRKHVGQQIGLWKKAKATR